MSSCLDDDPEKIAVLLAPCLPFSPAAPANSPFTTTLGQVLQLPQAPHLKLPDLECCSLSDTDFHLFSLITWTIYERKKILSSLKWTMLFFFGILLAKISESQESRSRLKYIPNVLQFLNTIFHSAVTSCG